MMEVVVVTKVFILELRMMEVVVVTKAPVGRQH